MVFNEGLSFRNGGSEVFLVGLEISISGVEGGLFLVELVGKSGNVDFTITDGSGVLVNVGVDDFDVGDVVQSFLVVKVVFRFLSGEELSAQVVEGNFEVIIGVVELGGKGDHVFHGTSQVGLLHLLVNLFEHHLLLGGSGSNGKSALEEHCSQNQANNESH